MARIGRLSHYGLRVADPHLVGNNKARKIYISFDYYLRVNVSIIQSDAEQGSVDLADFHIYCSVFHADSRGAIRFS